MSTPETRNISEANLIATEPNTSIQEFHQLQWQLMLTTLVLSTVIFVGIWVFYSSNIALNYLLGAYTGVVYLKVLARNVGQLSSERIQLGKSHLAIFIGLIILATQLNQLHVLPVFFGFLTYKITLLLYMLRTFITPSS